MFKEFFTSLHDHYWAHFLEYWMLAVLLGIGLQVYRLARIGRGLRRERTDAQLEQHTDILKGIGWLLLLALGIVELMVQFRTVPYAGSELWRQSHYTLDGIFVLAVLVTIALLNGRRSPRLHKWSAYGTIGLLALVLITGMPLLHGIEYRLP